MGLAGSVDWARPRTVPDRPGRWATRGLECGRAARLTPEKPNESGPFQIPPLVPDDLLWLFGDAGSGKGVVLAALRAAFGSYAAVIPAAEVTAGGSRGHSQWRARLRGARLMLIDDAPPRDLDCGVVNSLLGSVMSANLMRQGGVDFRVDAPLLVTANRLPTIPANDAGFRRRLKAVQAGAAIPRDEQDPELRRAVTMPVEQAAIVRWLTDGARAASGVEGGASETEGGGHPKPKGGGIRNRRGGVVPYQPVSKIAPLRYSTVHPCRSSSQGSSRERSSNRTRFGYAGKPSSGSGVSIRGGAVP